MTEPATTSELDAAIAAAFDFAEQRAWRSHDPFDLLLSPYAKVAARGELLARVWVQLGKRTGETTRRALRVPTSLEPKAVSDFLRAAALLAAGGAAAYRTRAERLAAMLESLQVRSAHGAGWGLTFPYASRFGRIERLEPNIYTTVNATQALLDVSELNGVAGVEEAVRAARRFLLEDLGFLGFGGHRWFRYSNGGTSPIVNVQASAAHLFARLSATHDDDEAAAIADACAATVLAVQAGDGSWPYSADGRASFVDGFHTGFTLEGLAGYAEHRQSDAAPGVREAIDSGMRFFERHLVDAADRPLGFADGEPTDDPQTAAQCVQTLVVCGGADARERAAAVWRRAVASQLDFGDQRLVSLRWSVGPSVLATAHLWAQTRLEA